MPVAYWTSEEGLRRRLDDYGRGAMPLPPREGWKFLCLEVQPITKALVVISATRVTWVNGNDKVKGPAKGPHH